MSTNPPRSCQFPRPRSRMHRHWLADDEAIGNELADGLAGVGVGDLVYFVRVEPDFALAAADDGGGETLLGAEIDPGDILAGCLESVRKWGG